MTDIIEKQALALVNTVVRERNESEWITSREADAMFEAICRALDQKAALQAGFDQFRQEVSDAVEAWRDADVMSKVSAAAAKLHSFILPKPKADPLVEAMNEMGFGCSEADAKSLRDALAKRNAKIVEAE